jgi:hypothetical protein
MESHCRVRKRISPRQSTTRSTNIVVRKLADIRRSCLFSVRPGEAITTVLGEDPLMVSKLLTQECGDGRVASLSSDPRETMISEVRFRVNTPTVTYETIEGESVVINLETGSYYSLRATGSEIWESLAANRAVELIVDDLSARYSANRVEVEQSVIQLIGELQQEQLIVPDGAIGASSSGTQAPSVPSTVKSEFQAPVLQKFTDMQELLLLDPIHDVDAAGWPRAKQDA